MGLSEWNKQQVIKITIDHTKLDSELTNFPILINLSENSGINDYDCSHVFDVVGLDSPDDNFDGNDGDPPTPLLWSKTFGGEHTGTIALESNKLKIDIDSNNSSNTTSYTQSKFTLLGDFDIQVDFDTFTSSDSDTFAGIELLLVGTSSRTYIAVDKTSNNKNFKGTINGSSSSVGRTNDFGKLKITRTDTTIYTYYQDGNGSWHEVAHNNVNSSTATVRLFTTITNTNKNTSLNFNNFKVNSGTPYLPSPIRKKIAVMSPAIQEVCSTRYDYNTKLLIHSNNSNNSVVFTDSSYYNNSITKHGDVHHDTSKKVFGTSSIRFVRVSATEGGYLSIPASSELNLTDKNFTLEFWLYCFNTNDNLYFIAQGDYTTTDTNYSFTVRYFNDSSKGLTFIYSTDGSNLTKLYSKHMLNPHSWTHVAVVRASSNILFFVNGKLVSTKNIGTASLYTSTHAINIGAWYVQHNSGEVWGSVDGYLDEIRYSVGIARWYTDFDPPTKPYQVNFQVVDTYGNAKQEQLYCEIERWDQFSKSAQLWVKVPRIPHTRSTILYLFYDETQEDNTTYVGDIGELPATKVWDTNFKGVYHLSQDPSYTIKDSTGQNDGSSVGDMTSKALTEAPVGLGLTFDGSDDGIDCNFNTNYDSVTLETFSKSTNTTTATRAEHIFNKNSYYATAQDDFPIRVSLDTPSYHICGYLDSGNDWAADVSLCKDENVQNTFIYASLTNDSTRSTLVTNADPIQTDSAVNVSHNTRNWFIGRASHPNGGGSGSNQYMGVISEIRISDKARDYNWLKTTYYTNMDNLLTLSSGIVYTITGYVTQFDHPVSRKVYCYERYGGELMDSCVSSDTGYYILYTTYSGEHNVVCLDDDQNIEFNDLIISRVIPEETL